MNFEKAYNEMLKGKKIRRKSWEKLSHIKYFPSTKDQDGTIRTYSSKIDNFHCDASILISKQWSVINGDGKELTFLEALEELKNKKEITNKLWANQFLFLDGDHFACCSAVESGWMPSYKCLMANDWEVMN